MRAIRALSALLLTACATTGSSGSEPAPAQTTDKGGPAAIQEMLPPSPSGFQAPVDVAARDEKDIFEQINGGSFSYLENGMVDALFATYPRAGGELGVDDLILEVYRFEDEPGARKQFQHLHGEDGEPWEGTHAVAHDYGLELVAGRLIIRVTFNDGPAETMQAAVRTVARDVLKSSSQLSAVSDQGAALRRY